MKVERAPTAFGPVSFKFESHLTQGNMVAELDLPQRNQPKHAFVRARVPDGWKVMGASAVGGAEPKTFVADEKGTVDVTGLKAKVVLNFKVEKRR